mgnify:FL=1
MLLPNLSFLIHSPIENNVKFVSCHFEKDKIFLALIFTILDPGLKTVSFHWRTLIWLLKSSVSVSVFAGMNINIDLAATIQMIIVVSRPQECHPLRGQPSRLVTNHK